MSEIDSNTTQSSAEYNPADDVIERALYELAADTDIDPAFAAALEARLLTTAEAMAQNGSAHASAPMWQRWQEWLQEKLALRPLRYGPAAIGLTLLLLLLLTPPVRATLWDWLYGMGLIAEQAVTDRTLPLETPVFNDDSSLLLRELQTQAPFAVAPPAWLPGELHYTGGFVDTTTTGSQATLVFHRSDADGASAIDLVGQPLLFMLVSNGVIENRPLLAEEQVAPVQIRPQSGGSALAMYAHGGWRSTQPVTPESNTIDDLYWDAAADEAWLSWQMQGLNYLLYAQGLGVTREEMVRIAESIGVE